MFVVEDAAARYVQANRPDWLPETQVYKGIENRDTQADEGEESSARIFPYVLCVSESASPVRPGWGGLWNPRLDIEVWFNRFLATDAEYHARVTEIFKLFSVVSLAAKLSVQVDGLHITSVLPGDLSRKFEGHGWATVWSFELMHAVIL